MANVWRLITAAARYHTVRAEYDSEEKAQQGLIEYSKARERYKTRFNNIRAFIQSTEWTRDAYPNAVEHKRQRLAAINSPRLY